jgi:hypothetical protein
MSRVNQQTPLTIAPVAASCGADAEFVDLAGLEKLFAIKRGLAYQLIQSGEIRSVTLRRRGQIKGKRLIFTDSVRTYLAAQPTDVDPKFSKQCREANKLAIEKRKENKAMAEAAQ